MKLILLTILVCLGQSLRLMNYIAPPKIVQATYCKTTRFEDQCPETVQPVCGYRRYKPRQQYRNQCEACADPTVKFTYVGKCD